MRAVYLAMQRMLPRLPIHARISSAVGPSVGAAQNQADCSLSCKKHMYVRCSCVCLKEF